VIALLLNGFSVVIYFVNYFVPFVVIAGIKIIFQKNGFNILMLNRQNNMALKISQCNPTIFRKR
jgi:hypothetical protein